MNKEKNDIIYHERDFKNIKFLINNFYDPKFNFLKKKVLDLGCGPQNLKSIFEKNQCRYTGYDINDYNFETDEIKKTVKYDLIISLAVLEHLNDPTHFIKNIKNLLKKNGYLYLTTPNINFTKNKFYNDYTHKKPYTPESIKSLFVHSKFKNVKVFPGLRLKNKWFYMGKYKFLKAYYLIPFRNEHKYIPDFLKGKSSSIILICQN